MSDDDNEAPPWDGWRWGEPLTLPEAEAIARKHAAGGFLTEHEARIKHREALESFVASAGISLEGISDRYPVYAQGIEYMQDKGITEYRMDVDPAILEREECEAFCGNRARKHHPDDWQTAYAECVRMNCNKHNLVLPESLFSQ